MMSKSQTIGSIMLELVGVSDTNLNLMRTIAQMLNRRNSGADACASRLNQALHAAPATSATKTITVKHSSAFDPAEFIDESWSYTKARDPRSAALGLHIDYSNVELSTSWLQGQLSVGGEIRHRRILESLSYIPLNCDHFLYFWRNKEKIPEVWKNTSKRIYFDADTLQQLQTCQYVLCLYWNGGEFCWNLSPKKGAWGADRPSAVLAS